MQRFWEHGPNRIGIVGSRRRDGGYDFLQVQAVFLHYYRPGDFIVSGGCPRGGDRFAEIFAKERHIDPIIFYPDVAEDGSFREAAYARNELIAQNSDILIACVAHDRRGGTENTIKHFRKSSGRLLVLVLPDGSAKEMWT